MQFKFESNQDFQLHAIESVAKLFDGQHYTTGQFDLDGESLTAIPNSLELDNDGILQNLQQVQTDNDLRVNEKLLCIEKTVPLLGEEEIVTFLIFPSKWKPVQANLRLSPDNHGTVSTLRVA